MGLTISNVHTRRIQTLSLPSTPSTLSSSTPSHQHLRAGFRQKSSSFCAIPTALLLAASPRMSVRSRAKAIEQTTALLGSAARWPQVSAWSKPLSQHVRQVRRQIRGSLPSREHLDEVLLGGAGFFALAQAREDTILSQKRLAGSTLYFNHLGLVHVSARGNGVEV